MLGNQPASFGKGATEKGLFGTSPVPYFIWSGGKAVRPYLSLLLATIAHRVLVF